MTFFQKIKWILGIALVFILILATNLIDRKNFLQIKESVETIYQDRLVAKELIFDLAKMIHEKEVAFIKQDTNFLKEKLPSINLTIQADLTAYEQTVLTTDESFTLTELKKNLTTLSKMENTLLEQGFADGDTHWHTLENIKENLSVLANIQMVEGRRHLFISQSAIDSIELFTQIELYALLFIAIIIQILIIYQPKEEEF